MRKIFLMWVCYTAVLVGNEFTSKCNSAWIGLIFILYLPLTIAAAYGIYNSRLLGDVFKSKDGQQVEEGLSSIECNPMNSTLNASPSPSSEKEKSSQQQNQRNGNTVTVPQENVVTDEEQAVKKQHKEALIVTPSAASHASHDDNQGTIVRENGAVMCGLTVAIGVVCSLLGIGGGELLSPLLLTYHISPQVTSATAANLSFFNTLSLVIRTSSTGDCDWGSGLILFVVGLVGGFIGRKIGLIVAFEYNRSSLIVFSLVVVLWLSCIYYMVELGTMEFESSLSSYC
jgi:hypothetical protein